MTDWRNISICVLAAALAIVWVLGGFMALRLAQTRRRPEPVWATLTWPVWFAAALCIMAWRRWGRPRV